MSAQSSLTPLIEQMKSAGNANLYFVALMSALVLPDIMGSLGSENGRASGSKYQAWLKNHCAMGSTNARQVYGFRCSLLHQGSAHPHGGLPRIAFVEPGEGRPQIHNLSTEVDGEPVRWVSVPMFVEEIERGYYDWLAKFGDTTIVNRNLQRFARRRPEGLGRHAGGMPVIA